MLAGGVDLSNKITKVGSLLESVVLQQIILRVAVSVLVLIGFRSMRWRCAFMHINNSSSSFGYSSSSSGS